MKIRSVSVEFHADGLTDGRTDMTNLIVAFRIFAKASKNVVRVYNLLNNSVSNSYCTYSIE
jgi:hypothetical protein